MGMHVSRYLKEELAWAKDKQLQVITVQLKGNLTHVDRAHTTY